MSPAAAVDIRSPVTSKHPSSFQNPNSNPIENNHRHSVKAPVFGGASEIDMNENGSQIGLGRARPRLVKVRRRLHGRNRGAAPGELCGSGSGFNPFKPASDDCCSSDSYLNGDSNVSNVGFVFGANGSVKSGRLDLDLNSRVELDFKEKEFGGSVGQLREKEPTLDSKMEAGEFGNVGFVFGANGNNVGVKFVSEKRQLNECGVNACEAENEKVRNDGDSESYDDRSELGSGLNTNEGYSSGNGVKLGSDDVGFVSDATHDGTCTNMGVSGSGFVFGPSWFDGKLNSNEGQRESGESSGDSAIADTGTMKVRHEAELYKVKGNGKGIFVSPSSSKKSSFLNESVVTKCPVEVKSSGETFLNCSISMDQNGNLNSSVNDKCTFASFANSSNVASASSMNPIFNLPEDIKKLNINEFKNVHGTDDKNSSAKDDSSFVFRSSKMVSASSIGSSGGDKFESSDKNRSCNTASTSIGISSSGLFTFQAGCAQSSFEAQLSQDQVNDDTQLNGAAAQTSLSSGGFDSQVNNVVSEATTVAGVDKENNESSSTNTLGGLGMPFTDFKTPWDPSCLKTSLFPELNKKLEFTANSRSKKGKRSQMRIRLKQDSLCKQQQEQEQDHVQNERSAQENLNTPTSYSPMDFSPYEETTAEKFSEETFVTSNDSNHQENNRASSILHSTEIAGLRESGGLDTDKDDGKPREKMNPENSDSGSERCFMGDYISKEFAFGAEMPCSGFNFVQVSSRDAGAAEDTHGLKTESSHQMQFSFASGSGDLDGRKFFFSASSSEQISSSAPKRQFRKKYRRKNPCAPYVVAPNPNVSKVNYFSVQIPPQATTFSYIAFDIVQGQEEDLSTPQRKVGNKSEINELAKQGSISSTDSVQEACEMWRAR